MYIVLWTWQKLPCHYARNPLSDDMVQRYFPWAKATKDRAIEIAWLTDSTCCWSSLRRFFAGSTLVSSNRRRKQHAATSLSIIASVIRLGCFFVLEVSCIQQFTRSAENREASTRAFQGPRRWQKQLSVLEHKRNSAKLHKFFEKGVYGLCHSHILARPWQQSSPKRY